MEIPNNVTMALKRLHNLKKNIDKRELYDRYDQEINKLLKEGYAEPVPEEQIEDKSLRILYLPHHAVITPKKPGKVRVVFDCAAKFCGESLNDKCLQGPDLNGKLIDVLLRYRQYPYVVMADIEAMYYQVKIPEEQRNALRFLWYQEGELRHYRMTGHVFGGIWCASSSVYALQRVIRDFETSPLVQDTVLKSFYVDDCLRSVQDIQSAEEIVKECPAVLSKGGFNLTKFLVNVEEIQVSIPEEKRAKIEEDTLGRIVTKALGV